MEDLSLLGNAAAVPVIVAVTQFLKKNFDFNRKADAIAFFVSLAVCFGWEFYYTPTQELIVLWSGGFIESLKHIIYQVLVSIATWMSASKSYDLLLGEKKRKQELDGHLEEKEALKQEVSQLRNGNGENNDPEVAEVDQKVRNILEGRD